MTALRWGIMGPGIIARRMAGVLTDHPECELRAVASRTPGKAEQFAADFGNPLVLSYEELANSDEIDVVYVATTHNFHYENAKLALEHGKHVLVEKAFTVNSEQARELVELAREKRRFLMEGMWVRWLPVYQRMKRDLEAGVIGELKLIEVSFGGFVPPQYEHRLTRPELAGGVTLDMGIYPLSTTCFLAGALPSRVQSTVRMSESGVDETASYLLEFSSGTAATINSSFNLKMRRELTLYGSEGYIVFPDYQTGERFLIYPHGGTNEVGEPRKIVETPEHDGFWYQVDETVRCIRAGKLESKVMPLDETVAIMKLIDGMRADWGFKYPGES